jgi:hypothetical protein
MTSITPRFFNAALIAAALLVPVGMTSNVLRAEDHKTYHDKKHNDDHEWNDREDRAYHMWAKESHRKYRDFSKLNDKDRDAYWGWRHEHSDAVLKLDIR